MPFRPCCTSEVAADIEHFRGADQRWGAEFSGDWGDASVRAEYIRARLDFENARPANLTASGWYVLGAKYLAPKWQVVAKHERLDPNHHSVSSKDVRQTTLGLNYYIRQNRVKLMAGYVVRQERIQPGANNLFQIQVQYFLHWPAHQRARAEQ